MSSDQRRKRKRKSMADMRRELDDLLKMVHDQLRLAMDFDDHDAVSLENLAHALQGVYFTCEKAEDIAGALAYAIDPKVAEKV